MVQRPFVGAADVHAGLFADGFKALQLALFRGIVIALADAGIELKKLVAAFGRGWFFRVCHKQKILAEKPIF